MMRTIETTIYNFYELNAEAQERAYNEWLSYAEYPYFEDFNQTLDQFQDLFNYKIQVSWMQYDSRNIFYNSYLDDEIEELEGVRLAKYLWNNFGDKLFRARLYATNNNPKRELKFRKSNVMVKYECPLTGCYTDHCLLDPMVEFMLRPRVGVTMMDLLEECFGSFTRELKDSVDSWFCMDTFNDECEVNDWEFYANGDRFYS